MTEKKTPGYYAIIPADVRYDESLSANAKLMYGEFTVLSNSKGYAFAKNKYFANLYQVSERTIRRWIEQLKENDYIQVDFFENSEGTERRISINTTGRKDKTVQGGGQNSPNSPDKNVDTGADKNAHINSNSSSNNTRRAKTTTTNEKKVVEIKNYWEKTFGIQVGDELNSQIKSLFEYFTFKEIKTAIYKRSLASFYKEVKPELRNIPKCFFAYPVTVRTDYNRLVKTSKKKQKLELTFNYDQMMKLFLENKLGGANGSGYATDDVFVQVEGEQNLYRIRPEAKDLVQLKT